MLPASPDRDERHELDLNDRLHRIVLTGLFVVAGAFCVSAFVMLFVGEFQLTSFVAAGVVLSGCVWLIAKVNSSGWRDST